MKNGPSLQQGNSNSRFMPFVTQYYITIPKPKESMSRWHLTQPQPLLCEVFKEPVISYKNGRLFKEIIVTANYNIYIWSRVSLLILVTNLIEKTGRTSGSFKQVNPNLCLWGYVTRKLKYNPACTRPIPYPETEHITVSPSYFHPASRLPNASHPTSRLALKPYPASR